uniref:GRIP and coiled-coil domain-containing protein 1, putative n=1 Tax=Riptortus pedestris TaxID=329032 RepID=R4WDD5_RIPPE|nr:GRIP and coiled-coil domain-containing protein 1, putative [Riptortus pedestris]
MEESRYKELIQTIERQNADLARYKNRLKDLVAAHKCLLKEKEVLESSLKAFSKSSSPRNSEESSSEKTKESDCDEGSEESDESAEKLKNQLTTLMNSLATLSEEKSRMEAGFQADKKQLRSEKLELEKKIKEMQAQLEHETRAHLSEMENFKSKLIIERHQREKEHNDHGVMIRELQKVVSEERAKREKTEGLMETLRSELAHSHEECSHNKKEAAEAKAQLEALQERLKDSKESSGAATIRLKHELTLLKQQLLHSTKKEQEKLEEAEKRSKELAVMHEERVANLEARLAELSLTVGNYDRLRQNDQEAITRLRERIAQLEKERGEEKGDLTLESIAQHIRQIILDANKVSEKPLDMKAILMECIPDSNLFQDSHTICQEEYDQLKSEFDQLKHQYQMRQQSDSPSFRAGSNHEDELHSQIKKLKSRIRELHSQIEENEVLHKQELEAYQKNLMSERKNAREKLSQVEAEWRGKLASVETQLVKQRQRAMDAITEREKELANLRASLIPTGISSDKTGDEGPIVLHYSEEVARRDVELTRLRKEKHKLEGLLRESERSIMQLNARVETLSQALRCQLDRFAHCQTREGANLEYLKNVVLSFLLTNDTASKSHMLNAIAAVLQFTDSEKSKISQHSWWHKTQSL